MKSLLLIALVCPTVFLLFGYNTTTPVSRETGVIIHESEPVVIQINHQDFPFDVNGNFPYVVMVDNTVWTFEKEDVHNFLKKVINYPTGVGEGRTRLLTN